jgi:hypothetical protein
VIVTFPLYRPIPGPTPVHGNHPLLARAMLESLRRWMPDAQVVQHSDDATHPVPGVDEVWRDPIIGPDTIPWHFRHMGELTGERPGGVLLVEADSYFLEPVEDVFAGDFDVALCRIPDRRGIVYSGGVAFCKRKAVNFWQAAHRIYVNLPNPDGWEDAQLVLNLAVRESGVKLLELDHARYNRLPGGAEDTCSGAAIVHYRGARKAWMPKAA